MTGMSNLVKQLDGRMLCGCGNLATGRTKQSCAHGIYTCIDLFQVRDINEAGGLGLIFALTSATGFPLTPGLFTGSTVAEFGMCGIRILQACIITNGTNWHNGLPMME